MRRWWPLVLVLAVQFGILGAIPARKVVARLAGTEVTLRTRPVDPYDLLSGYYVTLGYEVERPGPGQVEDGLADRVGEGERVYVNVRRGDPEWRLSSVSLEAEAPAEGRVSLRAAWSGSAPILEGVDRLFIPEDRRDEADRALREAEGRALVDLRVDADGRMAVIRLRVGDRVFGD